LAQVIMAQASFFGNTYSFRVARPAVLSGRWHCVVVPIMGASIVAAMILSSSYLLQKRSLLVQKCEHTAEAKAGAPNLHQRNNSSGIAGDARLVYNRVNKAGSTTMVFILKALGQRNHFEVQNKNKYFPSLSEMQKDLDRLPRNAVYINHAHFIKDPYYHLPKYIWINMVREPIDRLASQFYFQVDPVSRNAKSARKELQRRKKKGICGCAALDINACIRAKIANSCELSFVSPQYHFFCSSNLSGRTVCNPEQALQHMANGFDFIGITECMNSSIAALEHKFQSFFSGAPQIWHNMARKRVSAKVNKLTRVAKARVSAESRILLRKYWPPYNGELALYNLALQLFRREMTDLQIPTSC